MKRAIILIVDACGIGSMPDWKDFDEIAESNTLKSVCQHSYEKMGGIKLPNFQKMGIANIIELPGLAAEKNPSASYGKMSELSKAKDTITGHWEMVGIKVNQLFPYYPNGFPDEIIEKLKKEFGVDGILSNKPASGTTVINDLGEEHLQTGYPIIYTSADSVLQIACHVDKVPLETQYKWCEIAREIMRGEHEVARIIARPFTTNPDFKEGDPNTEDVLAAKRKFIRLNDKRHDYAILPHSRSILETVLDNKGEVLGLGKIQDIFANLGVPKNIHTKSNADGIDKFIEVLQNKHPDFKDIKAENQIIFINLVETDANFGHRRDPAGYAKALEYIDEKMPAVLGSMTDDDLLLITADHGCDPTAAGSDHTREYVPLLVYNHKLAGKDLGTRESFADLGATILDWFKLKDDKIELPGKSCLDGALQNA